MPAIFRSTRLGLLTVVAIMISACSATTVAAPSEGSEPAVQAIPVMLDSTPLRLPVQDFMPTIEQNDRMSKARLILIRRCLARFGVAYPVEPVPTADYGPTALTDRRYGITDEKVAGTYGYGLGPRDPALQTRPERPEIGAVGQTALTGSGPTQLKGLPVPEGGCMGEADRGLNMAGEDATKADLGNRLQFQTFEQSRADSRVKAAFAAWSACMGEQEMLYADPLGTAADPEFIGAVSPRQIQVATADIACKVKTNLVGVWFTVETAYQKRALSAQSAQFTAAKAAIEARDRSASTVIDAGL